MYKLIAVDMDGTLLNDNKEISDRCLKTINKLKEKGKKLVIATGRPLHGIMNYIEKLNLLDENDYVVTFNGALVQGTKTKHIIFNKPLSLQAYKELYTVSQQLGVNIHALTDKSVLTPKNNPFTEIESTINQIPIIEGAVEEIDASTLIVKVMFIDEPEKLDSILPLIPDWVKDKYSILRSSPYFLEFLDKSVDKGAGVSAIAKHLGLKREEVICVGDAGNDLAMIQYAGLGVAMGNATCELKSEADFITHSNEEDGVASVIEKFML
ncbi:MAG: yidA [Herbinix sp.]|jgi:Cof subfamily protein (haloacid dehalogenase superfamily)|nr:yidA [Herbinix sp.]